MVAANEPTLRFVPSAVEGLDGVSEVAVYPTRLEFWTGAKSVVIRFIDIARWYRYPWFYRTLARLGLGIHGWPAVADRDWFHPPEMRSFRFYTQPPITVHMTDEPRETTYGKTMFCRMREVMAAGGFATNDLG